MRSGGPSGKFGTVLGTLREVRDGSGDARGGTGRVGGLSEKSGTGCGTLGEDWETLREVRDGSGDPRGGPRNSW